VVKAGFDGERVIIAELDQTYRLKPTAKPEQERHQSRVPKAAMARFNWHNQRSEFLTGLNAALEQAGDDGAREALLRKLASALAAPIAPDQNAAAPPR
jgi:metallo-beta-lactamase family protein